MINTYRHELKYICSDTQIEMIKYRLMPLLQHDPNADENGKYFIRSLYFDDQNNRCFYENENGDDPRYKWRVRIYNNSTKRITLERKTKKNGMTAKESCLIDADILRRMVTYNECMGYFGKVNRLLDEWIVESKVSLLLPRVIVQYRRIPLIYHLGNVRITFDSQIMGCSSVDRFFDSRLSGVAVLPDGYQILEVKYDEYMPDIVYNLCDTGHLLQTTFSKFYLCCKALEGNLYVV